MSTFQDIQFNRKVYARRLRLEHRQQRVEWIKDHGIAGISFYDAGVFIVVLAVCILASINF